MVMQDILRIAAIDTVLGMGTVFAVLIIISLCIWGIGIVFKQEAPAAAEPTPLPSSKITTNDGAEDEEIIDAAGKCVAPGLIDGHVHFRDPGFTYKEDIHTGALSSAAGGFTTVICMANTKPIVDDVETLTYVLETAKAEKINVLQAGAVSVDFKGEELTDFEALLAAVRLG
jgi:Na+-transporting methylmalonyl-CoA/oxaloacetate decarboxylase gamma subunit